MAMIAFDRNGVRFNYRVAGVCVHDEYVLLQQMVEDVLWALPGGRAELLESSLQTLSREMHEEIGLSVDIGRLLWFVENFFTFEGQPFHELAVYYQMSLPKGCPYLDVHKDFMGLEEAAEMTFRWFPIDQLCNVPLYPTFLRTALAELPDGPVHLIHTDS